MHPCFSHVSVGLRSRSDLRRRWVRCLAGLGCLEGVGLEALGLGQGFRIESVWLRA